LNLDLADGTRTALVGPSGAGKTTLIRAIAGLERLRSGAVELDGRALNDLPAHRRRCAVVFQEPRLLPHFDVVENVAFPMRAAGVPRARRRERAAALLGEVGLGGFEGRRVAGLSGGEQQRVALARALCADPELLLLDEPLAAVDPNRREGLRRLIIDLQRERRLTTLFVTHDRGEAAEIGQTIALMLDGMIVQHDTPRAVFERPSSATVARFFGSSNLLRGCVRDGLMHIAAGSFPVSGPDGDACVTIRPERVVVDRNGPLTLEVTQSVYTGTAARLTLHRGGVVLEALVSPRDAPQVGRTVNVSLPAEDLWRLPRDAAATPRNGVLL